MWKRRLLPGQSAPHSLRLRLALWYGALLVGALAVFSALILLLTLDANRQSIDNALRAEARLATENLRRELSPSPPYWPDRLTLNIVDIYHDPGVIVEVQDAQGQIRYLSSGGAASMIPAEPEAIRAALAGQVSWYDAQANSEHIRVEAVPVRAPDPAAQDHDSASNGGIDADGAPTGSGPVIGVILVTKSLSDVDNTFDLLWRLLLLGGLGILAGALAGGWLIATRVLRPLGAIGDTARAIVAATASGQRLEALSRRVPRPGGKDELAQVVDTLNEMLAALERASQTQRRFIADASHELRAPLTTVQGNLAFLQRYLEEVPPEERRIMLADAYTETLRLARLIDDLLLLARADASADGRSIPEEAPEPEPEPPAPEAAPVELDRALLQLVRQLRRRLGAEGSKLRLEVGRIEPTRVRGEEEALRRIILILLDNAIKYTPAGDEADKGRITVSLERVDGQAVLRVRDTGIGIASADLPHIFERFYRADPARSRQGTGLGLSIAQMLVEQLGGHITVESEPGQGSTFSVRLPLA